MNETLLLPTDGSETIDAVVDHASDVAARRDATVHVLYVLDDRAFLTLDEERVSDAIDQLSAEGTQAVSDVEAVLADEGLDVTTETRRGDPVEEITAASEARDADLVVMGTHGADPGHNLLGSTAQRVVARSAVPVTVVPVSVEADDQSQANAAADD